MRARRPRRRAPISRRRRGSRSLPSARVDPQRHRLLVRDAAQPPRRVPHGARRPPWRATTRRRRRIGRASRPSTSARTWSRSASTCDGRSSGPTTARSRCTVGPLVATAACEKLRTGRTAGAAGTPSATSTPPPRGSSTAAVRAAAPRRPPPSACGRRRRRRRRRRLRRRLAPAPRLERAARLGAHCAQRALGLARLAARRRWRQRCGTARLGQREQPRVGDERVPRPQHVERQPDARRERGDVLSLAGLRVVTPAAAAGSSTTRRGPAPVVLQLLQTRSVRPAH